MKTKIYVGKAYTNYRGFTAYRINPKAGGRYRVFSYHIQRVSTTLVKRPYENCCYSLAAARAVVRALCPMGAIEVG